MSEMDEETLGKYLDEIIRLLGLILDRLDEIKKK